MTETRFWVVDQQRTIKLSWGNSARATQYISLLGSSGICFLVTERQSKSLCSIDGISYTVNRLFYLLLVLFFSYSDIIASEFSKALPTQVQRENMKQAKKNSDTYILNVKSLRSTINKMENIKYQ